MALLWCLFFFDDSLSHHRTTRNTIVRVSRVCTCKASARSSSTSKAGQVSTSRAGGFAGALDLNLLFVSILQEAYDPKSATLRVKPGVPNRSPARNRRTTDLDHQPYAGRGVGGVALAANQQYAQPHGAAGPLPTAPFLAAVLQEPRTMNLAPCIPSPRTLLPFVAFRLRASHPCSGFSTSAHICMSNPNQEPSFGEGHVLCGGFNCLRRSDYSDGAWDSVAQVLCVAMPKSVHDCSQSPMCIRGAFARAMCVGEHLRVCAELCMKHDCGLNIACGLE